MSDIVGAKAIQLASSGGIVEKPYARTFVVPGKGYEVTFGTRPVDAVPRYSCSCPAVGRCYHGEAAQLVMARQREEAGGGARRMVADVWGAGAADELARWAIDAIVEPPVRIDTATTRLPASMIRRGREVLEAAGLDWRKLKGDDRSAQRARREEG